MTRGLTLKRAKETWYEPVRHNGTGFMTFAERMPQVWYIAEKRKGKFGIVFMPIVNGDNAVSPTKTLYDYTKNFKVGRCYIVREAGKDVVRTHTIDSNGNRSYTDRNKRFYIQIKEVRESVYDELAEKFRNRDDILHSLYEVSRLRENREQLIGLTNDQQKIKELIKEIEEFEKEEKILQSQWNEIYEQYPYRVRVVEERNKDDPILI